MSDDGILGRQESVFQPIHTGLDITHHDRLERHRIEQIYGVPGELPAGVSDLGQSPIPARADHKHAGTGTYSIPVLYYLAGSITAKNSLPFHVNRAGYSFRRITLWRPFVAGLANFQFNIRRLGETTPLIPTQTMLGTAEMKLTSLASAVIVPFDPANIPAQFFSGIYIEVLTVTGNAGADAMWTIWFDFTPPSGTGALQPSTAILTSLNPNTLPVGVLNFIANGTGFTENSKIVANGTTDINTSFISDTQLQTNTYEVTDPQVISITVRNPGEELSNALNFTVT